MSSDPTGRANETKVRLRTAIADGYAMVKGTARAVSLASATPEQMMQEQIIELVGPSSNSRRPCYLDQVKNMRAALLSAIEQIRNMTPEELAIMDASDTENDPIAEEGSAE